MAYTPPPSKSAGDTLTEVNWNTHIKANFEAGVPDIFTTKGDIAAATAANTAAPLAVGANDSTIVADSGESTGLAWQIQPAARVYNSGDLDPATSTWVRVTFDSERFDTDTMHSTGSNTGRLTVPANGGGLYLIGGQVKFDTSGYSSGSSTKGLRVMLNGATVIAQDLVGMVHASYDFAMSIGTCYQLAATDYVELFVYTSTSVDVLNTGNYSPEFWAAWQRRA